MKTFTLTLVLLIGITLGYSQSLANEGAYITAKETNDAAKSTAELEALKNEYQNAATANWNLYKNLKASDSIIVDLNNTILQQKSAMMEQKNSLENFKQIIQKSQRSKRRIEYVACAICSTFLLAYFHSK